MVGTKTALATRATQTIGVYWALLCFVAFAPVHFLVARETAVQVAVLGGLPPLGLALVALRGAARDAFLARRDELTGLANRRAFVDEAHERLLTSKPGSVALVLLDVDALKALNDECGHAAGDELLHLAGQHLGKLRCSAYRIGGDEFGLLVDRARDEAVTHVLRNLQPIYTRLRR
jgi:GGDEF domain-containing protein